jgi:8-oxo-dGTP pyrophosphatase MutT (NUDIX family)
MFPKLLEQLRKAFHANSLPGVEAHRKFSPQRNSDSRFNNSTLTEYKESSVLVLLFPVEGVPFIPLIKRPDYDGIHSGQISLPGGKREAGDKDLMATALRETREEIGADPAQITILGQLTPLYIPPSNFLVTPFVGYASVRPDFKMDPVEVQKIIEAPVDYFTGENNILNREIEVIRKTGTSEEVVKLQTPYFDLEGEVLWGATAMILSELKEIIRISD